MRRGENVLAIEAVRGRGIVAATDAVSTQQLAYGEVLAAKRYFIETAFALEQAAATIAGEQSTGTFLRVPGETDALRERFAACVESIAEGEPATAPSLPGSGVPSG